MLLLLLAGGALASDRTADDAGARVIDLATRLVGEVGPRPARSPGAERAQLWVERELAARGWPARRVEGGVPEGSVLACRGRGEAVGLLALAHTDAVHADVPGANDNAAAVATLLVAAEELGEPDRPVCLGFPGGEEIGLRGSRALAQVLSPDLVVALDLVGRGTPTWNGLGPAWGTDRLRHLLAVAPLDVPWAYRAISHGLPAMERSDHLPFAAKGVPALHLMARGESGVYLAYHTAEDTPDQLQAETLGAIVGAVVALARAEPLPDEAPGDPAMVVPGTTTVIPGAVTRGSAAAGALLGALGAAGAVPWRAEAWGWLRVAGSAVVAALAAALVVALAGAGRDLGLALTGPALAAGWLAWAGAALAWPWSAPEATGRRFAFLGAATWAAVLTASGLFLLAWPWWALLACVLAARWAPVPAAALSLAGAAYYLSPEHARELDFHGMVPASPVAWGLLWLLLAGPSVGLLQGRALPKAARAVGLGLIGLAVIGAVASWALDAASPPFVERVQLPPAR
jgi:hypothetical protein